MMPALLTSVSIAPISVPTFCASAWQAGTSVMSSTERPRAATQRLDLAPPWHAQATGLHVGHARRGRRHAHTPRQSHGRCRRRRR
jgi:hypothetical protein